MSSFRFTSTQFSKSSSHTHIPGGHDFVVRFCTGFKENAFVTTFFYKVFSSTEALTITSASWIISDLVPVEHVQTPGGQAS